MIRKTVNFGGKRFRRIVRANHSVHWEKEVRDSKKRRWEYIHDGVLFANLEKLYKNK